MSRFHEAGPLARVGINLFCFYDCNARKTSCARTTGARWPSLLGRARAALYDAEGRCRRENIQLRANPFLDAATVANAQALERLGREVGALEGRHQPVQENDRMAQRYRP